MKIGLRRLPALGIVLGLLSLFIGACSAPPSEAGKTLRNPKAPDFTVATLDGSAFRLAENPGKATLLFFTSPG